MNMPPTQIEDRSGSKRGKQAAEMTEFQRLAFYGENQNVVLCMWNRVIRNIGSGGEGLPES